MRYDDVATIVCENPVLDKNIVCSLQEIREIDLPLCCHIVCALHIYGSGDHHIPHTAIDKPSCFIFVFQISFAWFYIRHLLRFACLLILRPLPLDLLRIFLRHGLERDGEFNDFQFASLSFNLSARSRSLESLATVADSSPRSVAASKNSSRSKPILTG